MAKSIWKDAIIRQLAEARAVVAALEEVLERGRRLGAEKEKETKKEIK